MKIYIAIQQRREIKCQRECLQRGYHHACYFSENNENCKNYKPIPRKEESDILKIIN